MHMVKTYEDLRNKLEREVDDVNKKEFTEQSVDILHKLIGSLYKVNCLIDMEYGNGQSNGYYSNGHSYRMMPYASYGRDGDNDGRYNESSRDNFRYNTYRGRSNENGYSRDNARQKMIQKLETLKDDTMSEYERNAINNCIEDISK